MNCSKTPVATTALLGTWMWTPSMWSSISYAFRSELTNASPRPLPPSDPEPIREKVVSGSNVALENSSTRPALERLR